MRDSADPMTMGETDFLGRRNSRHIGPERAGVWEPVLRALLFSFSVGRVLVPSVHNTHGAHESSKIDMLK